MSRKEIHKKSELKYRKTRIDRHNTAVNKFLDDAKENKKSVTRAIHELLDREAQLGVIAVLVSSMQLYKLLILYQDAETYFSDRFCKTIQTFHFLY